MSTPELYTVESDPRFGRWIIRAPNGAQYGQLFSDEGIARDFARILSVGHDLNQVDCDTDY